MPWRQNVFLFQIRRTLDVFAKMAHLIAANFTEALAVFRASLFKKACERSAMQRCIMLMSKDLPRIGAMRGRL